MYIFLKRLIIVGLLLICSCRVLVKGEMNRGHILVEDGGFRGVSGEIETL